MGDSIPQSPPPNNEMCTNSRRRPLSKSLVGGFGRMPARICPVRGRNSPAVGFQRLTSFVRNGRFSGISVVPKKLEFFSGNPLAREGPFWYITHPLRPKGARSILENRTVLKERDPAAPRTEGEPPEGTRNTMNEKLVVRCPEPARAPKTVIQQHQSCRNKIFFLRV